MGYALTAIKNKANAAVYSVPLPMHSPAVAQGRGVTQAAPMFGTRPLVG